MYAGLRGRVSLATLTCDTYSTVSAYGQTCEAELSPSPWRSQCTVDGVRAAATDRNTSALARIGRVLYFWGRVQRSFHSLVDDSQARSYPRASAKFADDSGNLSHS
jgi:hypothetical protein